MDNYKIINTHTNEIIKALNELGYVWTPKKFDEQDCLLKAHWILAKETGEIAYSSGTHIDSTLVFTELTLPQLRDLVVLKRNDVKDATHTDGNRKAFLDSAGEYHYWCFHKNEWIDSKHISYLIQYLKPIQTAQAVLNDLDELREEYKDYHKDPALISGRDALRALADGKEVQVSTEFTSSSWDDDTATYTAEEILAEETAETDDYNSMKLFFRLKPQTIKVELELPKPFKPKNGEIYWFVDSTEKDGYLSVTFHDDKDDHKYVQFGAYRTEEEIKQVVEQLRKIRGTNS